VNTYSFLDEFRGGPEHLRLALWALLSVFAGVIPAVVTRMRQSRLMLALVPFIAASFVEAWFVENLERVMVQALPAVCLVVLWRWPAGRLQRALTLTPVLLATVAALIHQAGLSSYLLFAPLLFAVAAEILFGLQRHSSVGATTTPGSA
jgi:hypothetical protein